MYKNIFKFVVQCTYGDISDIMNVALGSKLYAVFSHFNEVIEDYDWVTVII